MQAWFDVLMQSRLEFSISIFALTVNSLLAFFVYRDNRKSLTNQIFSILSIIIAFWNIATFFSVNPEVNIWWARLTLFFATAMSYVFFLLSRKLPYAELQLSKKYLYISLFATVSIMILALSPFAFADLEYKNGIPVGTVVGGGIFPFAAVTIFFSVASIVTLLREWFKSIGNKRKQLLFVMVGIFLMLGFVIGTIFVPVVFYNNTFFIPFVPLYTLMFLIMTAIAVSRYRLFNIKLIAVELLVATLITILFFETVLSVSVWQLVYKVLLTILVGVLGSYLVISVKKEIERREEISVLAKSLKRANWRLKEIDRQKTEFLSIAAHQLRTPLSVIRGYIELIHDGAYGAVGGEMDKILGNMDDSNGHLVKLIDEFLDITRIEQGRTKYDFQPQNINALINDVVTELKERAAQKHLAIVWKNCSHVGPSLMDLEKIHHVVYNFIDNAIKYSEKGKITASLSRENKKLEFSVTDSGLGFGKVDAANFFQKFYRGTNVQGVNVSGTGLGLYVCSKFIEAHGGKVWAKSKGLGKGSTFGFSIPYKQ